MKKYFGYTVLRDGTILSKRSGKPLKPANNGRGYLIVSLRINGKSVVKSVHRVIAECFIDNPEGYLEVNHKNGNKLDNRSVNLEWCSRGDNIEHAYRLGLRSASGVLNSRAKLTEGEVREICSLLSKGLSCTSVAKETGYSYSSVRHIRSREQWKEISKYYSW